MQKSQSANASKSSSLFQDCSKLILDIFIDCLVDNEFKGLIISGTATEKELNEAWDKIYVEYCQLSQDGTYNEVFEVLKEIDDLRAKITIANNAIKHIDISSQNKLPLDQDLINILNSMALRCNIREGDDREAVVKKLNLVVAYMKKWFPRLTEREEKLNELRKSNTIKIDRVYFDDWLDAISEDKGYHVKSSEITVSRFCRSIVKMREQENKEKIKQFNHAG